MEEENAGASKKPRVVIDGPICAGKTWLTSFLSERGFSPVFEPVTTDDKQFFYSDKARHGLIFDAGLATRRAQGWMTACEKLPSKSALRGVVADRWVLSMHVFLDAYMDSETDRKLLEDLMMRLIAQAPLPTHIFILYCSTDVILERLRPRTLAESADEEGECVTPDYLQKLAAGYVRYAAWLNEKFPSIEVKTIDATDFVNPQTIIDYLDRWAK